MLTTSTLITGNRIKVESFNANGCSSFSQDITVQIVDNPVISLTSTAFASSASSSTFCEGEAMTFTVTSTSAISTYTFFIGGIPQLVTTTNTFTPAPLLSYSNPAGLEGIGAKAMLSSSPRGLAGHTEA